MDNPVGNRTSMTTPWGKYSYTYDTLSRLASIINPQNITIAFTYDATGRRTSKKVFKTTPELLAESAYVYDDAGQLLSITNKAGGKVVAFDNYQYDANGNRVLKEDQSGTTKYGYDKSNRLITAEPVPFDMASAEGFVYDKNGNRRFDRGAKDYKYDAANRVLNNSVYVYTHDQNGNLARRTEIASSATVTYAYTPEQPLSEVVTPKDKLEYKYDPIGRRIGRTVNGSTTHYVYDGQDIIADLDEAGNQVNTYTNGPGIDEPLVMAKPDGKNYYYHADALGSITAITDDNRKLVETYTYKSYGQPTIKDAGGQIIAKSSVGNLRLFAAREYEPEIGFYNNRHRYLDPSRGAFTQEDPLSFNGKSVNMFVYVANNSISWHDPLGLWAIGVSFEISTINPVTSGGGGIVFGRNFEYTSDEGWNWYKYQTPRGEPSSGFLPGLSFTGNIAIGSGVWTGPFDSSAISFGPLTEGGFVSSGNQIYPPGSQ